MQSGSRISLNKEVEAWATTMFSDPKMRSMIFDHDVKAGADMTDVFGSVLGMVDHDAGAGRADVRRGRSFCGIDT